MIARDKGQKSAMGAYQRMVRLQYSLPAPLSIFDWIRKVVTTVPYDEVRAVVRALSNLKGGISVHPLTVLKDIGGEDPDEKRAKTRANEWETTLEWCLRRIEKRGISIVEDMIQSAAVYDVVLAQVIHMPTQLKAAGSFGKEREVAFVRIGDWAVRLADPNQVYWTLSDYGLEEVLHVRMRTAGEVVRIWGDAASAASKKIAEAKSKAEAEKQPYVEFEYVSHEDGKSVWLQEGTSPEQISKPIVVLKPQPWLMFEGKQVPFLPWAIAQGGTRSDPDPEFQLRPILFPMYRAEQFATANIMGTIMVSQALAKMAEPGGVITSPDADSVTIDYTDPSQLMRLHPGEVYQQLVKQGLEPRFREAFDRLEAAMQRTSGVDVLASGRPLSGEQPFAGYSLQVQQALVQVGGVKRLGEKGIESILELILLTTFYSGGQLVGYAPGKTKRYVIDSEKIDPDNIHIDVELKPDVPIDRVQRVQAAVAMAQGGPDGKGSIPYPPDRILNFLGETDTEGAIRDWKVWQWERADWEGRVERRRMEQSGQIQQMIQQGAMQLHEQMMQQQAEQQSEVPEGPGPGLQQPSPFTPQGTQGMVQGQMFNPEQGGMPPGMATPEGATFEGATGMTRGGMETP